MDRALRAGVVVGILLGVSQPGVAQRLMENLGRGVVAVNQGQGKVFVSWRLLGTEPDNVAFNVHRKEGNGQPVKLNTQPLERF